MRWSDCRWAGWSAPLLRQVFSHRGPYMKFMKQALASVINFIWSVRFSLSYNRFYIDNPFFHHSLPPPIFISTFCRRAFYSLLMSFLYHLTSLNVTISKQWTRGTRSECAWKLSKTSIHRYTLNDNIRRTQYKEAIVFLQEIGVAHPRKCQQIPRTGRCNINSRIHNRCCACVAGCEGHIWYCLGLHVCFRSLILQNEIIQGFLYFWFCLYIQQLTLAMPSLDTSGFENSEDTDQLASLCWVCFYLILKTV